MSHRSNYGNRPRQSKKEIAAEVVKLHGPVAQRFAANFMHERQNKSTTIEVNDDGTEIRIRHWRTEVAVLRIKHDAIVSCCLYSRGHRSMTTKECLNDVLSYAGLRKGGVMQKNHEWFANGREFEDGMEMVNEQA